MFWRMTGLSTASPCTQREESGGLQERIHFCWLGWTKGSFSFSYRIVNLGFQQTYVHSIKSFMPNYSFLFGKEGMQGTPSLSHSEEVETVLDKESFTLEELLDEDEIIQECKVLNGRLINFLLERAQVKQLIQYIVEEASEDADRQRTFKFPFIACEFFTCEVDIILKALVEDEELMDLLFSLLEPERRHNTLLAGYFSKVVVCLLMRKTTPLMSYILAHQDIIKKLVDLIGITSIMEVLIRLIGADEHISANYADSVQWLDDMNVLEMISDKFSSSVICNKHT